MLKPSWTLASVLKPMQIPELEHLQLAQPSCSEAVSSFQGRPPSLQALLLPNSLLESFSVLCVADASKWRRSILLCTVGTRRLAPDLGAMVQIHKVHGHIHAEHQNSETPLDDKPKWQQDLPCQGQKLHQDSVS